MNLKAFLGIGLGTLVLGLGSIAGTVAAQTPSTGGNGAATPSQQTPANPPAQTAPQAQSTPGAGPAWRGGRPGPGMGRMHGGKDLGPGGFGPGGMGFGGPGMRGAKGDNANGVSRAITEATTLLNLAKGDLAYANGKMDTTNISRWLTDADAQLKNAQSANSAGKYAQAGIYAGVSVELSRLGESQMAQALGADKLPSYTQRQQAQGPRGGWKGFNPGRANIQVTQAQASRVLAGAYRFIVTQGNLIKNGDGVAYLKEAQDAYRTAYNAYQAGKYSDAASSARLAQELAGIAAQLNRAPNAVNPDTPVTVPAPNF